LSCLDRLSSHSIEFCLGDPKGEGFSRTIRLKLDDDQQASEVGTWE
jgi:hypothetical protein